MKVNQQTAENILKHHFGAAPREISELSGGRANFVYEAAVDNDRYIVRIGEEPVKLQYFMKEQWAVEKVKEKKVPVPEILEVGNEAAKFPYMIVKRMEGVSADEFAPDRLKVVKEMGKYTAIINSIPTDSFGHIFDWSGNLLSKKETWKDYLEKELEINDRLKVLEKHNMLSDSSLIRLKNALSEMEAWNYKPSLNHGDMRFKNILLDGKGKICAILDWENCCSNLAPWWDMSIALHDLSIDEKEAFIDGYGMSMSEYRKISRGMKVLNIINYAPFVKTAIEERDKEAIDRIRARLHGALDLYSLEEETSKKSRRWLPFRFKKE